MAPEEIQNLEPGQDWEVDRFQPQDGTGVAQLFRTVYGEGYPIRHFVEPDRLREENAAGRVFSIVARTPKGDVVGHLALFRSAAWDGIAEWGSGVIHPLYRGGRVMFARLADYGFEVGAPLLGLHALFGEPVCNHTISQKAGAAVGFRTGALEVDLMPAAAYTTEKSAVGRVAAFLFFRTSRPRPQAVYLPECYADTLRSLYGGFDDERELVPASGGLPEGVATRIEARVFDFAQVARLAVHETGFDFADAFRREEEGARARGCVVVQAWLKASGPWVGQAVEELRARGYFLGGILPRWFDDDGLLLQKVWGEPSWEAIRFHSEGDGRLVGVVRADWERSVRRGA